MKKITFIFALSILTLTQNSFAVVSSPTSAKITVYGVALSQNQDCTNAKVIGYNPTGTTYDLLQNPAIVTGNIDPGTYQCVILYMKALLTFVPAGAVPGACTAGTTYSRVICSGGCSFTNGSPDSNNIVQFTGTQAATAANSQNLGNADKVLLFISTGSVGDGQTGLAFQRPDTVGSTKGIALNGALTVTSAAKSSTFVINFNNQIKDGGGGVCDLGPPTFAFR